MKNNMVAGIAGSVLGGVAIVVALSYNSKMPEIKAGIDTLKEIVILEQSKNTTSSETIADLERQLEDCLAENSSLKKTVEYLEEEKEYQLNKAKEQKLETEKANAEIEKANKEQTEILNYVNEAIQEISK